MTRHLLAYKQTLWSILYGPAVVPYPTRTLVATPIRYRANHSYTVSFGPEADSFIFGQHHEDPQPQKESTKESTASQPIDPKTKELAALDPKSKTSKNRERRYNDGDKGSLKEEVAIDEIEKNASPNDANTATTLKPLDRSRGRLQNRKAKHQAEKVAVEAKFEALEKGKMAIGAEANKNKTRDVVASSETEFQSPSEADYESEIPAKATPANQRVPVEISSEDADEFVETLQQQIKSGPREVRAKGKGGRRKVEYQTEDTFGLDDDRTMPEEAEESKEMRSRAPKPSQRRRQLWNEDDNRILEQKRQAGQSTTRQPPKAQIPQELWGVQKAALSKKFGETGWNPRRKLSPDAILGIRDLHASDPERFTTPVIANQFKVSPEAIRRILKSRWLDRQDESKLQERRERWAKRGEQIWDQQSELGLKPKRKKHIRVEDAHSAREAFEEELWKKSVLEQARSE